MEAPPIYPHDTSNNVRALFKCSWSKTDSGSSSEGTSNPACLNAVESLVYLEILPWTLSALASSWTMFGYFVIAWTASTDFVALSSPPIRRYEKVQGHALLELGSASTASRSAPTFPHFLRRAAARSKAFFRASFSASRL